MKTSREEFIAKLYPAARKVADETGMSWELILAQAAQETGWGQRQLAGTNNIFNIKAHGGWSGPTKTFTVWEVEDGRKVWRDDPFRVYGSYEEALRDRVHFLRSNPRYAKAGLFDEGTKGSLLKEAEALQKAGYATDPNYAKNLVQVFEGRTMRRALVAASSLGHDPMSHQENTIRKLQEDLNVLGVRGKDEKPLLVDGVCGPSTRRAIEVFQRRNGIPETGIPDSMTLTAARVGRGIQESVERLGQGQQYGLMPSNVQPGWPGVPYDAGQRPAHPPAHQPASPASAPNDRAAASSVPSPASQPASRPGMPFKVDLPADLVRTLQADLSALGMRGAKGAPLAEDGIYGRNTALAVAAFQREEGLSVTGIADNRTLGAVRSYAIVAGLERVAAQDVSMRAPDLRLQGLDDIALGAMSFDTLASPRGLHSFPSRDTAIMHAQRSVTSQLDGADVLRDTYPSSWPTAAPEPRWPDEPALRRAADMPDHFDPRQRANASPMALHDAAPHPQPQSNALRPFSDPSHPQHALYNDLKARLPEFPEERLAQIAGECHKRRYQAGWEGTIEVNDRAVLISQHWPPGRHLSVDLLQPAPPLQQTMQEMAGVDLQRTQMQDRNRQQQHQSAHSMG